MSSLFFESFFKCQNWYAVFWNLRGWGKFPEARNQGCAETFSPPTLEKCVGHKLKILDIVQKIWALVGILFAPPGVPSWLQAWMPPEQIIVFCGTTLTTYESPHMVTPNCLWSVGGQIATILMFLTGASAKLKRGHVKATQFY